MTVVKQFPAINRDEKVEISKGDLLNMAALLTSGGDAISTIVQMLDNEAPASQHLVRGCYGYVGMIFQEFFGVAPEDADDFITFLAAEERARAKSKGVDLDKLLGKEQASHPRDSMH